MFLHHEQCPKCAEYGRDRSSNNLGVWTDHKYCFSCGFYESVDEITRFKNSQERPIPQCGIEVRLPDDAQFDLPVKPLLWLKQYGLTNKELEDNHMMWSEQKQLLIFPVIGCNMDLLAWSGRYFGDNLKHPKYLTYGIKKELFHIIGDLQTNTVVVVEDVISAIKVSRTPSVCVMPLFCADINKYQLFRLSQRFEKLIIWLDPDKKEHSIKLQKRAESFFGRVSVVYSEKDPKYYTDKEIYEYVKS